MKHFDGFQGEAEEEAEEATIPIPGDTETPSRPPVSVAGTA